MTGHAFSGALAAVFPLDAIEAENAELQRHLEALARNDPFRLELATRGVKAPDRLFTMAVI